MSYIEQKEKAYTILDLTFEERQTMLARARSDWFKIAGIIREDHISKIYYRIDNKCNKFWAIECERDYADGRVIYNELYKHPALNQASLSLNRNCYYRPYSEEEIGWLRLGNDSCNTDFHIDTFCFTDKELEEWLKKYCSPYIRFGFSQYPNADKIGKFISDYKENLPNSEYFCKAGLTDYMGFKSLTNDKNPIKRKKILNWCLKHNEQIIVGRYSCPDIVGCAIHDLNNSDELHDLYIKRAEIKKLKAEIKKLVGKDLLETAYKWFTHKKVPSTYAYERYLDNCKELGIDLSYSPNMFPRDFGEADENVRSSLEALKVEKEIKAKDGMSKIISQVAEKLGTMSFDDGVEVKPLSSVREFVETGNELNNCVGRYGYDKKMANKSKDRKSFVVIVYKDGKKTECCEIDPIKKAILQCYGDHNGYSDIHDRAVEVCTKFAKERSRLWVNFFKKGEKNAKACAN